MSAPGIPMPPQAGAATPAPAAAPQGQINPQALMAVVQKGLVECVQSLAQQTGAPPPMILAAIKAVLANIGGGNGAPPPPAPGGMRPTQ